MPKSSTLILLITAICGGFLLIGECVDYKEVSVSNSQVRQALESLAASNVKGKGPDEEFALLALYTLLSSGHQHLQCSLIIMVATAALAFLAVLGVVRSRQVLE